MTISVIFKAELKHFFSKVIIISTDSLYSVKKRISFSKTFAINYLT